MSNCELKIEVNGRSLQHLVEPRMLLALEADSRRPKRDRRTALILRQLGRRREACGIGVGRLKYAVPPCYRPLKQ